VRVHAAGPAEDTVNVTVEFADGSSGVVAYWANGSRLLPKERLEVSWCGCSAVLSDFRRLELYAGRRSVRKALAADKGQRAMLAAFLAAVRDGKPAPIPLPELVAATRATFAAVESLRARRPIDVT
jgi:predicted dehydrogenase